MSGPTEKLRATKNLDINGTSTFAPLKVSLDLAFSSCHGSVICFRKSFSAQFPILTDSDDDTDCFNSNLAARA